jgi:hypothetical protein
VIVGGGGQNGVVSVRVGTSAERVRLQLDGVAVRDEAGNEVVKLMGTTRRLIVRNGTGVTAFQVIADKATADVGAASLPGIVTVRDGANREAVKVDGASALVRAGADGRAGRVVVTDG